MALSIAIFIGVFTLISLLITLLLGIFGHKLGSSGLKYHKLFALITTILIIIDTFLIIKGFF